VSKEEDKFKHSKRLHEDENAIAKQIKIAKHHGQPVEEPHRLAKHHVMDCGVPGCGLCSNPRHNFTVKGKDRLTVQERRNNQKSNDE
jgi:hypothetical protein